MPHNQAEPAANSCSLESTAVQSLNARRELHLQIPRHIRLWRLSFKVRLTEDKVPLRLFFDSSAFELWSPGSGLQTCTSCGQVPRQCCASVYLPVKWSGNLMGRYKACMTCLAHSKAFESKQLLPPEPQILGDIMWVVTHVPEQGSLAHTREILSRPYLTSTRQWIGT